MQPLTVEVYGSGSPLVLVPGFACAPTVWFKVVEPLARAYEVHLVSLPGFGTAPPVEPPVSEKVRDAIGEYVAGLGGAVLVGHSYGAFLSLWVAARRPDAVSGVVAVDGLPYLPTLFDIDATPTSWRERAEQERDAIAAGWADDRPPGPTYFDLNIVDPDDAARLNGSPRPEPSAAAEVRFEILTTDIRPEMVAIRCPVHYIAAGLPWLKEGDGPDGLASVKAFALERLGPIADVELVVAERARHFVMVDDPLFFLAEVDRLLDRLGR